MKSRYFAALMLILWLLPVALCPLYAQEAFTITHGPWLTDATSTGITVMWFTSRPAEGWVEYCGDEHFGSFPTWGGYAKVARHSDHGLISANTMRHAVRLEGLEPGKTYRYRVAAREIRQFEPYEVIFGDSSVGQVLSFTTLNPDKNAFTFGAVTDGHQRSADLDTLLQNAPLASMDFMLYTGDFVNHLTSDSQIFDGFLDVSVEHFAGEKPLVYVRGNHETRGVMARQLFDYFPQHSGRFYYSFNHGGVCFVVLDSGEDKVDDHPVYAGLTDFDAYREAQTRWLEALVQQPRFKEARYQVVISHMPLYQPDAWHGETHMTECMGDLLNRAGVDLMISGHYHEYRHVKANVGENRFPVLILDRDMLFKGDITADGFSITVKTKDGAEVERFSIKTR